MSNPVGTGILQLREEFPPVSTAEWEAVIQKDLKGASYEKKLVWHPEQGVSVQPYYRREALQAIGEVVDLAPGDFPYTRGNGQCPEEAQDWIPPAGAVRADYLHEAGATTVQELAFALAEGVEILAAILDDERSLDANETVFVYAIGSNYFFEIAKLRAARLLWSTAVAAFGDEGRKAGPVRIHARTARLNKSLFDPYTNLLRVTTEAASAMVAGCDSLTVESFGFAPHLSANVQRVLREEAYLTRVSDPAGGSYYVEALTDLLAKKAWQLFQEVEAAGGWSIALQSGLVEKALTQSREAQAAAVSSRRRTLVGVNNYPDVLEKASSVQLAARTVPPTPLPNDLFPQTRLAEPFEAIRRRTAAHARKTRRYPKILLLKRGNPKMKLARATFCLNFFGCAGFDLVEAEQYANTDADLIVLCSSDAEYPPFAREVCRATSVPVLVAGNPKEQFAELQLAGVQDFVHFASNAVETLTHWQNRLGMDPFLEGVTP
jgi:methylmalonyl-CoA mutase